MGRSIKQGGIKPISASITSETREILEKYKEGSITNTIENALRYYFMDKLINDTDKDKVIIATNIKKYKLQISSLTEQIEQLHLAQDEAVTLFRYWNDKGKEFNLKSKVSGDSK